MRRVWWLALALALALIGAACSDSGDDGGDVLRDSTDEESASASEPDTDQPGAADPDDEDLEPLGYDETLDLTFDDVHEFWVEEFEPIYGETWTRLPDGRIIAFRSADDPVECKRFTLAYVDVENNAFYFAPCDLVAYDDEGLFPQLFEDYGNFSPALVIGHELGHRVQGLNLRLRDFATADTIDLEQQADCFAGAWTAYVDSGESDILALEPGDLDIAVAGYLQFRDPPGLDPQEPGAHGTGFDRINAFQEGYEQGAQRCAEYVDERGRTLDAPPVVELEFQGTDDSGNVPLGQAIDFTTQLLDAYWPQAYGGYEPIDDTVEYEIDDPDEVDEEELEEAACGDEEADAEALDDAIFYCEEENFVAWDADLLDEVYDDTGDFGVATLIAEQYAHAVAAQQGVEGEDLAVNLYADCLNGSWAGAVYNNAVQTEDEVVLSPGDLDEAIQAFLAFRDEVDTEAPQRGSAFQRMQAFRTGFFSGPDACLPILEEDGLETTGTTGG